MTPSDDDERPEARQHGHRVFKRVYEQMMAGSRSSAEVITPFVLDLLTPKSVIDVGAGVGTWLSVFHKHGVEDVWGVEGDYVDGSLLEIPGDRFITADLAKPLKIDRRFDLVVSLEVAEHIPAESADVFVDTATGLGPVIPWSAAIPFQGGTGHVNEQWPEYWAERFRTRGFIPVDCLRRKIWQHDDVEWWYAQNLLVYVESEHLDSYPKLKNEYRHMGTEQLSLVHPQKYLYCIEWGNSLLEGFEERR